MQKLDKVLNEFNLLHKKEDLLKIAASSIGIAKEIANEEDIPLGNSKLGGLPDLPSHFSYPNYHSRYFIIFSTIESTLLFQMDSDDDLDVMWGDVGILYFCIDKYDLENKRFDKVKFTLQCY